RRALARPGDRRRVDARKRQDRDPRRQPRAQAAERRGGRGVAAEARSVDPHPLHHRARARSSARHRGGRRAGRGAGEADRGTAPDRARAGRGVTSRRADTERRTIALVAAVIVAVNALSLVLDPRDHAYPLLFAVDLAHGVLALAVAIVAARVRVGWSRARGDLAFVVMAVPFLVGLWLPQSYDS